MCTRAHLRRFSSSCRRVLAAYLRTSLRNNAAHLCAHVHIYEMVVDVNFLYIYVVFCTPTSFCAYLRAYIRAYLREISAHLCKKMDIYVFFLTSTCFSSSCRRVFAADLRTSLRNGTAHLCAHVHIYVVFQVLVDVFLLHIYEQVYEIKLHIYVHQCTSTSFFKFL